MSQGPIPADGRPPQLPERRPESHKGSFGRALLIGGSRGMAGAIGLAGMAALRGGAGLVQLVVPECCLDVVAGYEPSYLTASLPCDREGRIDIAAHAQINSLTQAATAIACGPGLGRSEGLSQLVQWLYTQLAAPLVVDADGLNALSTMPEALASPGGPRILTPHPGEFARLTGLDTKAIQSSRAELTTEWAARWSAIVVLKGSGTCISDGRQLAVNSTGNPGMATGGTGDVLTGLITALLCQGLEALDAARLGVHLHGLAGDLAANSLGQASLIASDLLRFLPEAMQSVRQPK